MTLDLGRSLKRPRLTVRVISFTVPSRPVSVGLRKLLR